jgi:hypothetical protein
MDDSAVSCAYDAMFRAAIALLEHYGDMRPGWNHGRLAQALRYWVVSGGGLLHGGDVDELKGVYTLRITADSDDRQITVQEAQSCLTNALRFIILMARIISHETHT